jgi:hypothetical protein
MKEEPKPCENCGHNRWKTKRKYSEWECRGCGGIRKNYYNK